MTTPSTKKQTARPTTTPKRRSRALFMFWSVRARMSAAMLPTLVAPKRMDGWSDADDVCLSVRLPLSLCLSIGEGRCSGRALTYARGCVEAASDCSHEEIRCGTLHSISERKKEERLTRLSWSSLMKPERGREGGEGDGRREWLPAGWLPACLSHCSVCLFPSLPPSFPPSYSAAHAATHLSKSEYHKHAAAATTTNDGRVGLTPTTLGMFMIRQSE